MIPCKPSLLGKLSRSSGQDVGWNSLPREGADVCEDGSLEIRKEGVLMSAPVEPQFFEQLFIVNVETRLNPPAKPFDVSIHLLMEIRW